MRALRAQVAQNVRNNEVSNWHCGGGELVTSSEVGSGWGKDYNSSLHISHKWLRKIFAKLNSSAQRRYLVETVSLGEAENSFSLAVPSSFYPCLGKYSSQCRWYLKLSVGFISRTNLPAPESSQVSCNNWYPQSLQTWPACSLWRQSHRDRNNNWGKSFVWFKY